MKIQYAGDLHVEFGGTPIRRNHLVGDVLVLAGDIHGSPSDLVDYLKRLYTTIPIIYVLGNHEFHAGHWGKVAGLYQWRIEKEGLANVFLLDNDSVEINGIRFLGTTLWSDCANGEQGSNAEELVADFRRVNTDQGNLTWKDMADRYRESLEWLKKEVEKPFNGKTVVITHFAPSLESNAPEYGDSPVRKYYCNQLDDWIKNLGDQGPDLWIHGHTHFCVDYKIGKTRVVSNQRGYNQDDVPGFDPKKTVET